MNPRTVALVVGAGRVAFGSALLLAPASVGRGWIGVAAAEPGGKTAVRAVGARDIVLGIGVLLAARRASPIRGWVEGGLAADVADFAIALSSFRDLPPMGRFVTLATAGGSALIAAKVLASMDDAAGEPA